MTAAVPARHDPEKHREQRSHERTGRGARAFSARAQAPLQRGDPEAWHHGPILVVVDHQRERLPVLGHQPADEDLIRGHAKAGPQGQPRRFVGQNVPGQQRHQRAGCGHDQVIHTDHEDSFREEFTPLSSVVGEALAVPRGQDRRNVKEVVASPRLLSRRDRAAPFRSLTWCAHRAIAWRSGTAPLDRAD